MQSEWKGRGDEEISGKIAVLPGGVTSGIATVTAFAFQ